MCAELQENGWSAIGFMGKLLPKQRHALGCVDVVWVAADALDIKRHNAADGRMELQHFANMPGNNVTWPLLLHAILQRRLVHDTYMLRAQTKVACALEQFFLPNRSHPCKVSR